MRAYHNIFIAYYTYVAINRLLSLAESKLLVLPCPAASALLFSLHGSSSRAHAMAALPLRILSSSKLLNCSKHTPGVILLALLRLPGQAEAH
jgi:hypothetical protein